MRGSPVALVMMVLSVPAFAAAPEPSLRGQATITVQQKMPEHAEQGEAVPVEIILTNTGTAAAEGLTATTTLPPEQELLDAAPAPERARGMLTWSLGALEPKEQRVLRLRLSLRASAAVPELVSRLTVKFQTTLTAQQATTILRPDLDLVVADPDLGTVGEPLTLRLAITNKGTRPAEGVTLQTLLPPGLEHSAGADLENEIGNLPVGQARSVSLTVTPTRAGDGVVRLCAAAHGVGPVQRELHVRSHETRVTATAVGPGHCPPGSACAYQVSLRNEDIEAAHNVRLVVHLPDGISFVRGSDAATYDAGTHSVIWALAELGAGEMRTVVWNGVARQVGEQQGDVLLTVGKKTCGGATWQTCVTPGAGPGTE